GLKLAPLQPGRPLRPQGGAGVRGPSGAPGRHGCCRPAGPPRPGEGAQRQDAPDASHGRGPLPPGRARRRAGLPAPGIPAGLAQARGAPVRHIALALGPLTVAALDLILLLGASGEVPPWFGALVLAMDLSLLASSIGLGLSFLRRGRRLLGALF